MEPEPEPYSNDYEDIARTPPLFGFLFGWFGQTLLSETYDCDIRGFANPNKDWDLYACELFKLATMVCAWRDTHGAVLPKDLTILFHDLAGEYGPTGYRSSSEAIGGPADPDDPRRHRTAYDPEPRDYWPDLLIPADQLTGRLGKMVSNIRKVLAEVGCWTEQENALHAGAVLARYATGPWFDIDHDQDRIDNWLQVLVDLDLMVSPDSCDDLGEEGDSLLHRLRDRLTHTEDFEALRDLPLDICNRSDCYTPPRRFRVCELPDLETAQSDIRSSHDKPPITVQEENQPILVLGKPKSCPSISAYYVLSVLAEAYPGGVSLRKLKKEAGDARGILRRLREDADWKRVICMPGENRKGGYRLVWPQD